MLDLIIGIIGIIGIGFAGFIWLVVGVILTIGLVAIVLAAVAIIVAGLAVIFGCITLVVAYFWWRAVYRSGNWQLQSDLRTVERRWDLLGKRDFLGPTEKKHRLALARLAEGENPPLKWAIESLASQDPYSLLDLLSLIREWEHRERIPAKLRSKITEELCQIAKALPVDSPIASGDVISVIALIDPNGVDELLSEMTNDLPIVTDPALAVSEG